MTFSPFSSFLIHISQYLETFTAEAASVLTQFVQYNTMFPLEIVFCILLPSLEYKIERKKVILRMTPVLPY